MKLFPTIKQSLTSTQFYTQVRTVPFRESVMFWVKFYLFLVVLLFIPVVVSGFVTERLVRQYYPENLSISYKDGTVHTEGFTLPYTLRTPSTTVELTNTELKLNTDDGQEIPYTYSEIFNNMRSFTVTKQDVITILPKTLPFVLAAVVLSFVVFLAIFRIPIILLYAFVIRSVLNLLGRKVAYQEILQMSVHAAVVAELVNLAYLLVYRSQALPMFDLAFFGTMFLALRSRRVQIVKIG